MWTIWGARHGQFCDGLSRRDFLRVGALGLAGLGLSDLLRSRSAAGDRRPRSVIMIVLPGGPSHIDLYDPKPDAPAEVRGDFKPIPTNVPGIRFTELVPLQARIADKLAVLRGLKTHTPEHHYHEVTTGFPPRRSEAGFSGPGRPAFGSVVSYLRGSAAGALPPFVSLRSGSAFGDLHEAEDPAFLGVGHRPFVPQGTGAASLRLSEGLTTERLGGRKQLLQSIDELRRNLDAHGEAAGLDEFTQRAFAMLSSPQVRDAFDVGREPDKVVAKYGPKGNFIYYGSERPWDPTVFVQARRLVEAGVPVVSLAVGSWDHHSPKHGIFADLRTMLPFVDAAIYGLVTDLYERGLDKDVAVVIWGEMGRTPKITPAQGGGGVGRDHWPDAGCALFAGGGFRVGQVIGATDNTGAHARTVPYTPQHVLATLYHVFGIDPTRIVADRTGRPMPLLDDCEKIKPLL
jgi:hypothetical protein